MEESTQERRGSEEGSSAGGRRSKDDHNIIVLNSARKRELEKIGSLTQALTGQSILRTYSQTGSKKEKNDKARAALNIAVKDRVSKRVCDVVYERAQEEK